MTQCTAHWVASVSLVALLLLMLGTDSFQAEAATLSCDVCLDKGYPYFCDVPISTSTCFSYSGESTCREGRCVCCRAKNAKGCELCSVAEDDIVDDRDLLGL